MHRVMLPSAGGRLKHVSHRLHTYKNKMKTPHDYSWFQLEISLIMYFIKAILHR